MKYLVLLGTSKNGVSEVRPELVQVVDMPDTYNIEADAEKLDDLGEPFIELRDAFMDKLRARCFIVLSPARTGALL